MDARTYWATKSLLPEYHGITFEHPAFSAPFRLVANQFAEVMLGGQVHTPAPMAIKPPEQKGDAQPKLTLSFPRQVVGRAFKQQLGLITAAGSRAPIEVRYEIYTGAADVPRFTWLLYASDATGVSFDDTTVQVVCTDDNPMRRDVSLIYDPAVFTGLELL